MNENSQINHGKGIRSDPIGLLKDEHHMVLGHLEMLERSLQYLESQPRLTESKRCEREQLRLWEELDLLEQKISRHFQKEEQALFPVLSEYLGSEQCPISVLVKEHSMIRHIFQIWKKTMFDLFEHSGREREMILREVSVSGYEAIHLLRIHISKENQILFEICEASLSIKEKNKSLRRSK